MRSLSNFSALEYLQFLPLRHALMQMRNDVWLGAYLRKPVSLQTEPGLSPERYDIVLL